MSNEAAKPITREQLESMSKEAVIDLLLIALESQSMATHNMQATNVLLEQLNERMRKAETDKLALETRNQTLEAELISLRSET